MEEAWLLPSTSDFGESPPPFGHAVVGWFVGMMLGHAVLLLLIARAFQLDRHLASVLASCIVALAPGVFTSLVGTWAWFFDDATAAASKTAADRIYQPLATAQMVLSAIISYEAYNTMVALFHPEFRTVQFVGHHVVATYGALLATAPVFHYYTLFSFGVCSISTCFLCVVDAFKQCEPLRSHFPTANLAMRAGFALSFLALRTCYGTVVLILALSDIKDVLLSGGARRIWPLCFWGAAMVCMMGLQVLWSVAIVKQLCRALGIHGASQNKKGS
jgi:hypothetical protein